MKNKKGISPIIAFVLLLSLAVVLGVIITTWARSTAESQVDTMLKPMATKSECEQVNININRTDEVCELFVYNSGTLKIEELEINVVRNNQFKKEEYKEEILPRQWSNGIMSLENVEQVEIFPIINVDGDLAKCQKNKVFEIVCP